MLLSEVTPEGTVVVPKLENFEVAADYIVKCEAKGQYIMLVVGVEYGKAAFNFQHENIAARRLKVFEYKHCNDRTGHKWWTQKPGVFFHFIMDKSKIELVEETGYSWPKVKVGGMDCTLNCSGGTNGKVWVDVIGSEAHTSVNMPMAFIKHVANLATPPDEAKANGYSHDITRMDQKEKAAWSALALKGNARKLLKEGSTIITQEGCSWGNGIKGPFTFHRFDKKSIVTTLGIMSGLPDRIDWLKTADANGWPVPLPTETHWNKVGECKPTTDELADEFFKVNEGKLITLSAWAPGNNNDDVPEGYVGVCACLGGHRARMVPYPKPEGYQPPEEHYFLVPKEEYDNRTVFLAGMAIDPERHKPWKGPKYLRASKEVGLVKV